MRWLKRIAIGLGVLLGVLALAFALVWAIAGHRARRHLDVALLPVPTTRDSAAIARGKHLAIPIGQCVSCHRSDLGGEVVIDDPGLSRIVAPNLTAGRGGVLPRYDDAHFARAVRNGVAANGRPLMIMPSAGYHALSDTDMAALIANVRTRPKINNRLPPSRLGPLGRVLSVFGLLPLYDADRIDQRARPPRSVTPGPTAGYGRYLAQVGGCTGCHGPGLSGGPIPGAPPEWPPASNLTPAGLPGYNEAAFRRALRSGRRPDGTPIDTMMPWRLTRGMTDEEMGALWRYLRSVPSRPYGGR